MDTRTEENYHKLILEAKDMALSGTSGRQQDLFCLLKGFLRGGTSGGTPLEKPRKRLTGMVSGVLQIWSTVLSAGSFL